jgi:hypothetical protein
MDEAAINPLLLCCICEKPFVEPCTADDARRGCRSCLSDYSLSLTPIEEVIVIEMLNSIPVRCSQCGDVNIRRGNFKKHQQEACKRAVVPCKAADMKCSWKGAREQLDEHLKECIFEPLRPALEEIINENKQFQERISKLENIVNRLTRNQ